jgi:hypothetical protein
MTNRVSYAPQELQKMCKQAERDQESKKLVALMDRVKRQIAEREDHGPKAQGPKAAGLPESGRGKQSRVVSKGSHDERRADDRASQQYSEDPEKGGSLTILS